MVKLSATILAYNEEKRIGACLESLCGVADEIIVVDSYSTDRTVEICEQYGCRITRRLFDGFGAQRRGALARPAGIDKTHEGRGIQPQGLQCVEVKFLLRYAGETLRLVSRPPDTPV